MSRERRVISTHLHPGVISDRYRAGATSAQQSQPSLAQAAAGRGRRLCSSTSYGPIIFCIRSTQGHLYAQQSSIRLCYPNYHDARGQSSHEPRAKPPRMRRSKCCQVPFSEDYPFDTRYVSGGESHMRRLRIFWVNCSFCPRGCVARMRASYMSDTFMPWILTATCGLIYECFWNQNRLKLVNATLSHEAKERWMLLAGSVVFCVALWFGAWAMSIRL